MIKRIFSFALAALLLWGMLPQMGVQAQAESYILESDQIDGREYSSVYGEKLNQIIRGEVALFSDCDVRLPLGTSMKTGTSYTVAGIISGYQCYIYAQAVYYYLFGDVVYHGSGYKYWSDSHRVLKNETDASYDLFAQAGVGFGAYIRTTTSKSGAYNGSKGHSLIVLAYDEETITYLEGNADGKGLVRITEVTWETFDETQLSGRGRRIAHVVQCDSAACLHRNYTDLGACADCGASFDVQRTYQEDVQGYYIVTKEDGASVKADAPYAAAADILTCAPDTRVEVQGSMTNALGETWYLVSHEGQTGYMAAEDLLADPVTPGKPVIDLTTDNSDVNPIVISWRSTANTTHYDLRIEKKDQDAQWQTYAHEPEAVSGVTVELPAGEYQAQLRAYNAQASGQDGDWLYTAAEPVSFRIFHSHTYTVVTTTQATCTVAGEKKYICLECGSDYSQTLPMEEHNYVEMRCTHCDAQEKPVCELSVKRSSGKPVLSWGKVSGAKKYEVYRATSETGKYTKLTTTTKKSYTDSKASADSRYFYKIRVISSNEANGKYSAVRTTCARPVVKAALTEEGKPVITWNTVAGAVQYKVYRSTKSGSGYKVVATVEETAYTDLSASSGKTYYYKVVAVGEDSESAASSYKKVAAKCVVPELEVTTGSSGKPALSWNKISGAKKYEIYRSVNGGSFKKLTTTTKTSYTDSKATGGAVCTYKIRALGSSSSYHSAYSETVDCNVVCATPSVTVKADTATGKPSLSWKKITGAAAYEIYRSENGGEYTLVATQTGVSYKDTDAQTGVKYAYQVRALGENESFHSGQSTAKSVTAVCAQPKPKGKISAAGKPVLVWSEVEDATEYAIYRSTSKSKGYKKITQTDDLTYTDTTAKKNKTYYYKIVALSDNTQSAQSGYVKLKAKK